MFFSYQNGTDTTAKKLFEIAFGKEETRSVAASGFERILKDS